IHSNLAKSAARRAVNPRNFFTELKRRNVYKIAIGYGVVAWLLLQAASILFPTFEAPPWTMKVFVAVTALGFPIALIIAWAFELTPEGLKRTELTDELQNTSSRNLPEIAQALKVAHVLEGSVQRSANRVRVSAQLIDARNDTHVWADKYDRDLADVFAIQSEIAQKIADQLQAKMSPRERSAIEKQPTKHLPPTIC